jgi:diguanylate cyclase (GGDEF)-like protein
MGLRSLSKGNLESITVGPNLQGKIIAADVHPALKEQSLQLGLSLQTTLDVYELIRIFNKEIQPVIQHSSLEYQNSTSNHGLELGHTSENHIKYNLEIENEHLGVMDVSKNTPFSKQDLFQLENAITQLVYPLRNALKYHNAIIQALTCPLTNLGNKKAYMKSIVREVESASRHKSALAILVLDIDNFKNINDTFGHQAGDYVLNTLGSVIAKVNRNSDIAFRFGGEEFVILLSNTDNIGALEVAKRLQESICATNFTYKEQNINVTLSIGITQFQQGDTPDRLFARADQALFQAKRTGKNKIVRLD